MSLSSDSITQQLVEFVRADLMERAEYPLRADEPLITSGLIDSFSLARVSVFIEESFGVYLPDTELTVENMDTVNAMVQSVIQWNEQ